MERRQPTPKQEIAAQWLAALHAQQKREGKR